MPAPTLRSVADAHPALALEMPRLPERDGLTMFVVTSEGGFLGHRWAVGDVVVCRGEARSGDATVLVARGQGRPRLGSVQGTRVLGDAGEPCHPSRWEVSGRLVAAYRSTVHGWVVDLVERGAALAADRGERSAASTPVPAVAPRAQLSLFAA